MLGDDAGKGPHAHLAPDPSGRAQLSLWHRLNHRKLTLPIPVIAQGARPTPRRVHLHAHGHASKNLLFSRPGFRVARLSRCTPLARGKTSAVDLWSRPAPVTSARLLMLANLALDGPRAHPPKNPLGGAHQSRRHRLSHCQLAPNLPWLPCGLCLEMVRQAPHSLTPKLIEGRRDVHATACAPPNLLPHHPAREICCAQIPPVRRVRRPPPPACSPPIPGMSRCSQPLAA